MALTQDIALEDLRGEIAVGARRLSGGRPVRALVARRARAGRGEERTIVRVWEAGS